VNHPGRAMRETEHCNAEVGKLSQTIKRYIIPAFTGAFLLLGSGALNGQSSMPNPVDEPAIRVKICSTPNMFSSVNVADIQIALQAWASALSQRMGLNYMLEVIMMGGLSEVAAAVLEGQVEVIGLTGLEYLEGKDQTPMRPAIVGVWGEDEQVGDEYVLLVRRDSGLERPIDLKGGRLIFDGSDQRRVATIWLDVLLLRGGLPESRHFLVTEVVEKAPQAALPVFFGKADACIIRKQAWETMGELNPQMIRELKALAHSPRLLFRLMCFRRDSDPGLHQALLDATQKMHIEIEGQQMLAIFRIDRAVRFELAHLKGLQELVAEHARLRSE
jgi:ABC-type phosphate/phosphonate transport system substrate-binding protein